MLCDFKTCLVTERISEGGFYRQLAFPNMKPFPQHVQQLYFSSVIKEGNATE